MPVTLKFYKLSEKKPKHLEDIIWLEGCGSFGSFGFNPREIKVEYSWTELDEAGFDSGNSYCYDEKYLKDFNNDALFRLDILFDGNVGDDDTLWCSVEEYWEAFEKEGL